MFTRRAKLSQNPGSGQHFPGPGDGAGFTLIELLVVIGIIAVLAGLVLPALSRAKQKARSIQCLNQMRQLGLGVRLHASDNEDAFPRSQHSAFANGELPWERAIAPELGSSTTTWSTLLNGVYHCPADRRTTPWSYGLNVYFELGPDDDYPGKPQSWRNYHSVPRPSATVLFSENQSGVDHIMPNFWSGPQDAVDVPTRRHLGRASYAFVDGHAESLDFVRIYDTERKVDCWNPESAH